MSFSPSTAGITLSLDLNFSIKIDDRCDYDKILVGTEPRWKRSFGF